MRCFVHADCPWPKAKVTLFLFSLNVTNMNPSVWRLSGSGRPACSKRSLQWGDNAHEHRRRQCRGCLGKKRPRVQVRWHVSGTFDGLPDCPPLLAIAPELCFCIILERNLGSSFVEKHCWTPRYTNVVTCSSIYQMTT